MNDVSERLGICTKTLDHWLSKLSEKQIPNKVHDEQLKIAKLETALKRMTEKRDILKKAARYFASDTGVVLMVAHGFMRSW